MLVVSCSRLAPATCSTARLSGKALGAVTMWEPIETWPLIAAAVTVWAVAGVAPIISLRWYRAGHSEVAAIFISVILTGATASVAWIAVWIIVETVNRSRMSAHVYQPIFSGEAKLGIYLLWLAALAGGVVVATVTAVIVVIRDSLARGRAQQAVAADAGHSLLD
jgi:hypothetical protein